MLKHTEVMQAAVTPLEAKARNAGYLSRLSPHQVRLLIVAGTVERFPAKQAILNEGTDLDQVYVVLDGTVTVSQAENASPSLWLDVYGPGTVVDITESSSFLTAHAASDVKVLTIPRSVLAKVMGVDAYTGRPRSHSDVLSLVNHASTARRSPEYQDISLN